MKKVILASHGNLAQGMKDTIRMLSGMDEEVYSFCFHEGQDLNDLYKEVKALWNKEDDFIIITDIPGGSVNTILTPLIEYENVHLLSGMNTTLVLTTLLTPMVNIDSISQNLIEGKESLVYVNQKLNKQEEGDDFFD